ncbi:glycosyltransferase [Curtobacterium sp. L1-20]|uniref:glycosyltransferase n=1 Tax=Curtobacterium sp. L1-20 TaxID=3138181 RepID=UPI003B528A3F
MVQLFASISTVLVVSFCAYVLTILIPFLRRKPEPEGQPAAFQWHFFIPCRDEEAVIGTTIGRARERFPTAHVWIIDDDSDDRTADIVRHFEVNDPLVHLVERHRPHARIGKGAALNAAYDALNAWLPADADHESTLVCVLDADGEMEANAFAAVATDRVFGDPTVGAAQITVWMKNRNDRHPLPGHSRVANLMARALIRMQDMEFRTMIAAMQTLREHTSTVGLGGNGQFTRLSVLDLIRDSYGEPWHGSLLEDYELGVHVLLAGYQTRHVHDTHVSQEALTSFRRFLTQRTRWSQGNIQCARYLGQIFASRHFDTRGVLESAYYLVLPFIQVIGFVTWMVLVGAFIQRLATDPQHVLADATPVAFAATAVLFTLFGVAPFAIWGPVYVRRCEPQKSLWKGLLYGLGMWFYVFYMYVSLSRAFVRVVLRRNGWAKTRRNAEVDVTGAIALES